MGPARRGPGRVRPTPGPRRATAAALLGLAALLAGIAPATADEALAHDGPAASAAGRPAVASEPAGAAAGAGSTGACPTLDDGVTVVVDFRGQGGRGVEVRCAPGAPSSGFDALDRAGFDIVLLPNQFLCRIDELPPEEPCQGTGAASTEQSWAYSGAERGGTWALANRGGFRSVRVGTVEGWTLRAGQVPGTAPPAPPPATTTTTTTPAPPTTGGPAPTPVPDPGVGAPPPPPPNAPEPGRPPGDGPAPGGGPGTTTTAPADDATDDDAEAPNSADPPDRSGDDQDDRTRQDRATHDTDGEDGGDGDEDRTGIELAAGTRDDGGPGGATGLLVTLALVAVLGGLGIRQARRHRADPDPGAA